MGEMSTFFLWVRRVKKDSGRGLSFSLKFGLAPFFYDFLKFDLWAFFSEIKDQKFYVGLLFFGV